MERENLFEHSNAAEIVIKKLKAENDGKKQEGSIDMEDISIPGDVIDIVLEYSGVDKHSEKYNFFNSRGLVSISILDSKLEVHQHPFIIKLLYYVVRGEQHQAEAMIKKNPEYLFASGQVIDYSGRKIKGTALQVALGAEDVAIQAGEICMVEMISHYLRKMDNGEFIIAEQIKAQFPEGWEENATLEHKKDVTALEVVVKAIADSKDDDACEHALTSFRKYLEDKTTKMIITGKHFNVQLLVEAYKLYNKNYQCLGGHESSPKNIFYWRKIIGYTLRFLPACYAQAFCQGIYYLVDCKRKLRRSLMFHYTGGKFYPLDSEPLFRLGYDYAVEVDVSALPGTKRLPRSETATGAAYQSQSFIKLFTMKEIVMHKFIKHQASSSMSQYFQISSII